MLGTTGRHPSPVIEHWNSSSWTIVPVPPSGYDSHLDSVAAVGPDDLWAVGAGASSTTTKMLFEHWDGTSWTIVPSPPGGNSQLNSVSGPVGGPLFAAGYQNNPFAPVRTLVVQR